jgi:hypothetical protein
MKTHPISEKLSDYMPLNALPAGQDPQVEKPHDSSNPWEKLPTSPDCEPHFFYSPGL